MPEDSLQIGDHVIVHVGFAIEKVDRQRADEIWQTLEEVLAMMDEEEKSARSLDSTGDD
jgi:hydrogenase expression/formation protein HypC